MDNVQIRDLFASDHDAWLRLWLGYQAFYGISLSAELTDTTFHRLLRHGEPMSGALAWHGHEAVGLVHFIRHRSTWTVGDYMYLQDLFTIDHARGAGVGRALIEHVYARAEAAHCSRVYWLTHETNGTAMKLYDNVAERSGFIQYRRQF
ncbi:GNAT family N-acetyltransferase [Sphingomonas sp.]|uniref:GNAT family N-acetyltransferase n=1 Tax=Sphingomonas sp. TaxID=28214 RepID=UPI000DB4332D|nr:GNAT family N-acetyltransferase [Sphingomonas sp.]PZU06115.1 MAG: GNAT family N-acetyltransferase [Sphingomonas sp.]